MLGLLYVCYSTKAFVKKLISFKKIREFKKSFDVAPVFNSCSQLSFFLLTSQCVAKPSLPIRYDLHRRSRVFKCLVIPGFSRRPPRAVNRKIDTLGK